MLTIGRLLATVHTPPPQTAFFFSGCSPSFSLSLSPHRLAAHRADPESGEEHLEAENQVPLEHGRRVAGQADEESRERKVVREEAPEWRRVRRLVI